MNRRTDISWVRRLTGSNPEYTEEFANTLFINNVILYEGLYLVTKLDMNQFLEKRFMVSL